MHVRASWKKEVLRSRAKQNETEERERAGNVAAIEKKDTRTKERGGQTKEEIPKKLLKG